MAGQADDGEARLQLGYSLRGAVSGENAGMDFYRIAIRRNPTGSMRLRVRVHLSKTYSSVRFQFGLMTKDTRVALVRAWVLWCALYDVGLISSSRALCALDGMEGELMFDRKGEAVADPAAMPSGAQPRSRSRKSSRTHAFDLVPMEDGCHGLALCFSDKSGDMTKSFPLSLMTSDAAEAECRAHVILRSFSRILERFDAGITCRASRAAQQGGKA